MKQITINIPDNCELKQDGNTYTIVEKEKKLTYEDVARKLFSKSAYYVNSCGSIGNVGALSNHFEDLTNCTSEKQAKKLLAINKLMNVAKYLNGDWQPDWDNKNEFKYIIYYSNLDKKLDIDYMHSAQYNAIFFRSRELAKQAIEIVGEETIKLALCTDY